MHLRPLGEHSAQWLTVQGKSGLHCLPLRLGASPGLQASQRNGLEVRQRVQPGTSEAHGPGEPSSAVVVVVSAMVAVVAVVVGAAVVGAAVVVVAVVSASPAVVLTPPAVVVPAVLLVLTLCADDVAAVEAVGVSVLSGRGVKVPPGTVGASTGTQR